MPSPLTLEGVQKTIYLYMKKKARSYEGPESSILSLYRKNQVKYSKRDFQVCDIKALIKAIDRSHIVYLGDFHTFDQSSKNLERIVHILMKQKKKLTLGVEFIHQNYQEAIDQYLQGHLTELEFLETIQYKDSWRFPWFYYKVFFDLAKKNLLKIVALNHEGNLEVRDQKAAALIAQYLNDHPEELMLVLFGEYHIAPNKLPAQVGRLMNENLCQTIIHQNLDEVYWKLEKLAGRKKGPLVQFNEYEFSLQTSPPWIKYESMIYWYENLIEDPEFEIHHYMLETGHMAFNSSVPDTFHYTCQEIATSLGIKLPPSGLDDFNIYDHQKMKQVERIIDKLPTTILQEWHRHMLLKGKMFKLPFRRNYYCSSYSINRISYLAGIHLLDFILGQQKNDYEEVLKRGKYSEKFIFMVYRCTMGHLASKIINPYRKCDLYQNLLAGLQSPKTPSLKKKNLRLVKKILDNTQEESSQLSVILRGKSLITLYYCAKSVGHMFGDLIYDHHMKGSKKSAIKLVGKITQLDFSEESFHQVLQILMPKDSYKEMKKRIF